MPTDQYDTSGTTYLSVEIPTVRKGPAAELFVLTIVVPFPQRKLVERFVDIRSASGMFFGLDILLIAQRARIYEFFCHVHLCRMLSNGCIHLTTFGSSREKTCIQQFLGEASARSVIRKITTQITPPPVIGL